jgi:hypothetical protein
MAKPEHQLQRLPVIVTHANFMEDLDCCCDRARLCAEHEQARTLRIAMTKMIDRYLAHVEPR